jgi:hypothetical protein
VRGSRGRGARAAKLLYGPLIGLRPWWPRFWCGRGSGDCVRCWSWGDRRVTGVQWVSLHLSLRRAVSLQGFS